VLYIVDGSIVGFSASLRRSIVGARQLGWRRSRVL
jgi:hypothetical protein